MFPIERNDIQRARTTLNQNRSLISSIQAGIAAREAAINRLSRTAPVEDDALAAEVNEHSALLNSLRAARAAERTARADLGRAIGAYLAGDPTKDVGLLAARYPIVLFPVRVETRFDRQSSFLLIRIYPDEILADAHEPELTADEEEAGKSFWTDAKGSVGEAEAWRRLVSSYKPQRAAWLVRATDPESGRQPERRPSTWTRAVEASLLPDRWIAIAYRDGTEVARGWSSTPVIQPLALTVGPSTLNEETVPVSGNGFRLDDRVVWTVDFGRAEEAGMAIRMPLSSPDFTLGIDRLIVFGVRATLTPEEGSSRLQDLLDAQHYTRGLAFVAQGTPTNDSKDAPSGYPPPDPNGTASLRIERGASLATKAGDGVRWAAALGISPDLVAHVDGADRQEQSHAEAMNRALFPATWGYFLDTMMSPVLSGNAINQAREFFVNRVRACGPLPAFRVGGVPYGTLPVSSLRRWTPRDRSIEENLVPLLLTGREFWMSNIGDVPHIGKSSDSDADLLAVLGMDASARALRLRKLLGEDAHRNLIELFGFNIDFWKQVQQGIAGEVLSRIGHPEWDPRVLRSTFDEPSQLFRFAFVAEPPLSEKDVLAPNYINWIRNASINELENETPPFPVPNTLLYNLLRYAALTECWLQAKTIMIAAGLGTSEALREHELIRIVPGTENRPTIWSHFAQPVPSVTGSLSIAQYLSPVVKGQPTRTLPEPVIAYRDALSTLEGLPTAELHRLTTETIDLSASRLDAWITGLFSKRLEEMRAVTKKGTHVGAFAWVENLHPRADNPQRLLDGRVAHTSTGGYIHAPSMTHAATAAILRNGFLTHASSGADSPYAINLSSIWVRRARFVLESVQAGQSVGAVFGYQIERGLHERQVEFLIDPLRNLFPLVANKATDSGEPAEAVAARNVVDGLQLCTAWREKKLVFGSNGLPASGPARVALEAELGALEKAVLAVANLLLAESVHQIVRGSAMGASAALDSLAKGVRPPEPEVVHSPRGGTDLTHRIILVVGGDPLPLPEGWPLKPSPRAMAEPRLDAWVGTLLGDPRKVKCRVVVPPDPGSGSSHPDTLEVTLDKLNLRPLDILALAASVNDIAQASELDRRVIFAAINDTPALGPVQVLYKAATGWDRTAIRTIPEVFEVAQALSRVIGGGRPMRPEDLLRGEDASAASGAIWADDDAIDRAQAAKDALKKAREELNAAVDALLPDKPQTDLQVDALRAVLRQIADFGFRGAFPVPGRGVEEGGVAQDVIRQAKSVLDEVDSRIDAAEKAHPEPNATPNDRAFAASEIARQVFGRDFLLLPGFQPAGGAELTKAMAASDALVGDPHAAEQWFQQVSRIRVALQRWRKLQLFANALDAPEVNMQIVQLPFTPQARWAALPFKSEADRRSGVLSFALLGATLPAATTWFGLHLDEWVDVIPNSTELTGLAFHYDDPGAEAAQAILIAVPPDNSHEMWDCETLVDILNETFELARIRGVDSRLLGGLGQLLPAMYIAQNPRNDTISTRLAGSLVGEKIIKATSA